MQKFKISTDKSIKLNGIKFKPYTVGNLPPSFGFKYDEDKDKDGIYQWFNYKGLTYVEDKKNYLGCFCIGVFPTTTKSGLLGTVSKLAVMDVKHFNFAPYNVSYLPAQTEAEMKARIDDKNR